MFMKFEIVLNPYGNNAVIHRTDTLEAANEFVAGARFALVQVGRRNDLDLVIRSNAVLNGVEVPNYMIEAIRVLVRHGETIHAIKMLRAHTCAGLKEAKDAVDSLRVEKPASMV